MAWTIESKSIEETEEAAQSLAERLEPGDFIALEGDLGAGKTQFVRGLARGLGLTDEISSPTFTILQIYNQGETPLHHFDLYRLEDSEDVINSGLEDTLFDPGAISVVEWSERITDLIPDHAWIVRIERSKELPPIIDGVLPTDEVPRSLTIRRAAEDANEGATL